MMFRWFYNKEEKKLRMNDQDSVCNHCLWKYISIVGDQVQALGKVQSYFGERSAGVCRYGNIGTVFSAVAKQEDVEDE